MSLSMFSEETTMSPINPFTPDPNCKCGCAMMDQGGKIVSSIHCRGSTIWIIQVEKGYTIHISFEIFTLDPEDSKTWLKVRISVFDISA